MWQNFLVALSLVFVLEGIAPFVSPWQWRQALAMLVRMDDRKVRLMGLISMLLGTALLYIVH